MELNRDSLQTNWFIILLLCLVCFPAGLLLLWAKKEASLKTKIIISTPFVITLLCTTFASIIINTEPITDFVVCASIILIIAAVIFFSSTGSEGFFTLHNFIFYWAFRKKIDAAFKKRRYDLMAALAGYIHEHSNDYLRFGVTRPIELSYRTIKALLLENQIRIGSLEAKRLIKKAIKELGPVNYSAAQWMENVIHRFYPEIAGVNLKLIDGFICGHRFDVTIDEDKFKRFVKFMSAEGCPMSRQELLTYIEFKMFHETLLRFDGYAESAKTNDIEIALGEIVFAEGSEYDGSMCMISDALRRHGFGPQVYDINRLYELADKFRKKSNTNDISKICYVEIPLFPLNQSISWRLMNLKCSW